MRILMPAMAGAIFALATAGAFAISATSNGGAQSTGKGSVGTSATTPAGTAAAASSAPSAGGHSFTAGLLLSEALSTSRDLQLDALRHIASMVKSSPSARSTATIYTVLSAVVLSGTERPTIEGTTIVNDFPVVRMQACTELGLLGGDRSRSILLDVLRYDTDPFVLSQAAISLAQLGGNPDNSVSDAIAAALRRTPVDAQGSFFAYTALQALQKLAMSSSADPVVYQEIATVRDMGYGHGVAREASSILKSMMSTG